MYAFGWVECLFILFLVVAVYGPRFFIRSGKTILDGFARTKT